MKFSPGFCLLVVCSLMGVGSAIRCYRCKDYTGTCIVQRDCSNDDACLTLTEGDGLIQRQCVKYVDCEHSRLSQMFPRVTTFTFKCCTSDLCNSLHSVPTSSASSLIGLLSSPLFFLWWCIY